MSQTTNNKQQTTKNRNVVEDYANHSTSSIADTF